MAPPILASSESALSLWDGLLLGLLQGLTEFLPISSSGHLALSQHFLGLEDTPRFFDVLLHVGTLAAVVFHYRAWLWAVVVRSLGLTRLPDNPSPDAADADNNPAEVASRIPPVPVSQAQCWRLAGLIILATLPAVAVGLAFRPSARDAQGEPVQPISWRQHVGNVREFASQRPLMVCGFLLGTAVVLLVGYSKSQKNLGTIDLPQSKAWQALVVGIAQACSALGPGLSRSGLTVSTGLFAGWRGDWAVHFSLLMSLPAIIGATLLKARDVDPAWLTTSNLIASGLGMITAAVVGYACIQLLLLAVRRQRWWWFSIYLIALSLSVSSWVLAH